MFERAGDSDTICALSTAPGVGGIAVIRVSGSRAASLTRMLCDFLPEQPESHKIYYGILRSAASGSGSDGAFDRGIDEVLVSFFANGRSFTGEETTEISCHGGTVLTATILKELIACGCRMANPGEFTYRAFMNGKLDLVQAESVLGLIESQSKQSAKVALRQLQGHLSADFNRIEDDLLWVLAMLEASIDFSTEGLEYVSVEKIKERGGALKIFIEKLMGSYKQGRLLREGLQIALVGKANAGKSSLLNALLKEERAIVTPEEGTTRDLVEGRLSVGGFPVTFVDTAGLRETGNEAERIGIARSRSAMTSSDFVFVIVDLSSPVWRDHVSEFNRQDTETTYYLFNKADLDRDEDWVRASRALTKELGVEERSFWLSAKTRSGIREVEAHVAAIVQSTSSESTNVVTQARHLEQLQKIHVCLSKALDLLTRPSSQDSSPEFIAFELQEAIRSIHELLGKEFHEQVIDRIFKEFCLGK